MQIIIEEKLPVYLSTDEAKLFLAFQKNYHTIAQVLGVMDSLGVKNMANGSLTLDFNSEGMIQHSSITKHYRK